MPELERRLNDEVSVEGFLWCVYVCEEGYSRFFRCAPISVVMFAIARCSDMKMVTSYLASILAEKHPVD